MDLKIGYPWKALFGSTLEVFNALFYFDSYT